MIDPTKIVDKIIDRGDEYIYTDQERAADVLRAHSTDMNSDSKLAKNIRPASFIWAMLVNSVIWLAPIFGAEQPDITIAGAAMSVLLTIIGFYFNSRKAEKVAARKSAAAVKIKKWESKAQIRQDKRAARK